MRAAEKNKQMLSSSETYTTNSKYKSKKCKINIVSLNEYLHYMHDEGIDIILE